MPTCCMSCIHAMSRHPLQVWEAAVDVAETGDLSKTKAMQDYNLRRDVSTFNSKVRLR